MTQSAFTLEESAHAALQRAARRTSIPEIHGVNYTQQGDQLILTGVPNMGDAFGELNLLARARGLDHCVSRRDTGKCLFA